MTVFRPTPDVVFTVGDASYRFVPHPLFPYDPEEVYVLEGGEALVYQVQEIASGYLAALKVPKPSFRGPHIARSAEALAPYAQLPGLALAQRVCLTREAKGALLARYPDLEFAVLMPWLTGITWAGLFADRMAGAAYGAAEALALATATAEVLWQLEAHHLAHTDLAGSNVVVLPDWKGIELLDIEHLYQPQVPPPPQVSRGTPGYQHPYLGEIGQWCAEGDRFAGGILLAEMLAWADPLVRAQTLEGAESLFQPGELQSLTVPHWQAVRDALWAICPPTLNLFDAVWASSNLATCPDLAAWALALLQFQA